MRPAPSAPARSSHLRNVMGLAVRAIRAIDRRTGFTVRRGHAAYAIVARRLAGPLHRRILADALACAADHPVHVVVDLGSGPGTLTADLGRCLPAAMVIGVEPSARMLEIAREAPVVANVRFAEGSAEHLPFLDASVDLIVSSLSAHHWDDLAAAVGEVRRVLRPGGCARIYDLRFATFTLDEVSSVRERLALPAKALRRFIPRDHGRLHLTAVIEVTR